MKFFIIYTLTLSANSTGRTGWGISVLWSKFMSSHAMCLSGVIGHYSIIQKWMFVFCCKLKMFGIYTCAIVTSVMKVFSTRYIAISHSITNAMNHISFPVFFNSLWPKINKDSSVPIRLDMSRPLPTPISQNYIVCVEVCNKVLFLKTSGPARMLLSFKSAINSIHVTRIFSCQRWSIYSIQVFNRYLRLLSICKYFLWHNNRIIEEHY